MRQLPILFVVALLAFSCKLQAQVGINTANPNKDAALHIMENSKGVLLPTVDSVSRAVMISNNNPVPSGMLVFDPKKKAYYFLDADNKKWLVVNPWRVTDGDAGASWGDIRLDSAHRTKNVYIGPNLGNTAQAKLHVEGTFQADGLITAKAGVNVTGSDLRIGTGTTIASNGATIGGNTTINGSATVTNTVTASTFVGVGTVPVGGIIMWSGISGTIPNGWALCDGGTVNGFTTPDLRGRFIVGYGTSDQNLPANVWDWNYANAGNLSTKGTEAGATGGQKEVTLTESQMPNHSHFLYMQYSNYRHGDSGNEYTPIGAIGPNVLHERDGSTNNTGGNQAHENRPPYYVLAFIMRIQ